MDTATNELSDAAKARCMEASFAHSAFMATQISKRRNFPGSQETGRREISGPKHQPN
jgi:hypothetical protein